MGSLEWLELRSANAFIEDTGARAVVVDAFDRDTLMSVFADVRPEVVIHQLTALSDRDFVENSRIRVEGTRNLVDASLKFGVAQMIAQSISWAYEPRDGLATEEASLDIHASMPRKRMINAIVALEQAVADIPCHSILRYGMFYGPGTWYDQNGFMAGEIRRKQIPATKGVTSFVHVDDAVNAAILALEWPEGSVNIVDDEPAEGIEWLPVYADALGAPMPDVHQGHEAWERGASNAKARNQFGWNPVNPTWRTGLPRSLE